MKQLTLMNVGREYEKNLYAAEIFNNWKADVRDQGERAMRHFFIDFDRDKN